MAVFELLFGRKTRPPQFLFNSSVVLLQLDVSLSEEHTYENMIPAYPLDANTTISDHIWKTPDKLRIEGQVSNAPIKAWYLNDSGLYGKNTTQIGGEDGNRVLTAYEVLLGMTGRKLVYNNEDKVGKGILQAPVMVDVITNLCVFTNMVVESLRIPRNSGVYDELVFDISFVKITRSTVYDTNINYTNDKIYGASGVEDQNQNTSDAGTQPNTESKEPKKTILKSVIDSGKPGLKNFGNAIKTITLGAG